MVVRTEVVRGHILPDWLEEDGWRTADPMRRIRAMVVLRPADPQAVARRDAAGGPSLGVDETNRLTAPDPIVVVRLADYLAQQGLHVDPPGADGLYLPFSGPLEAVTRAFRCTFAARQVDGRLVYLNREEPQVPLWAAAHVLAVVGLENRSALRPTHRYPSRGALPANNGRGFFPGDLKACYNWPSTLTGAGEAIGLLEFSNGYSVQDVDAFWRQHGIEPLRVAWVSVDGTANDNGVNAIDMECTLDVEWAGAMAPGAELVVYEAAAGADDVAFSLSMLRALERVGQDTLHHPGSLSISYGDAESRFPAAVLQAWDQAAMRLGLRGITVLAASGDMGAYGIRGEGRPIPHADAPASLSHVTGVGGTTLILNPDHTRRQETGWTDTNNNGASGGGVSVVFPRPVWQAAAGVPLGPLGEAGRGVPDVALVADPDTGVAVVFQGEPAVIGGTSASTPMWAALVALANEARVVMGRPRLGPVNPRVYALGGGLSFHDIVQGNNSIDGVEGYSCRPGWDAVTGWGSVHAAHLIQALTDMP